MLIEVTNLTEFETKSLSVISEKNYVFLKMNGMFYFLVATLRCEGLAILPKTECIDYVNADGKKDADMTLHKGCIREESIQGGRTKFKK